MNLFTAFLSSRLISQFYVSNICTFYRGRFNLIWDQLLKNIAAGKKSMIDLIEHATLAFDQREEWCLKVIALQKKAQNDLLVHSEVPYDACFCSA